MTLNMKSQAETHTLSMNHQPPPTYNNHRFKYLPFMLKSRQCTVAHYVKIIIYNNGEQD